MWEFNSLQLKIELRKVGGVLYWYIQVEQHGGMRTDVM
jgi:hypothetical protein